MPAALGFDSSVLSPFARARKLDVLERLVAGHRCVVTQAVLDELDRGCIEHPALADVKALPWLELVTIDSLEQLKALTACMRALGSDERNIGEASILAWAEVASGIAMVDDSTAVGVAKARGVRVRRTLACLCDGIQEKVLTIEQATLLVDELISQGGRAVPMQSRHVPAVGRTSRPPARELTSRGHHAWSPSGLRPARSGVVISCRVATDRRLRSIALAGLGAWIVTAVVLWATAAPLGDNEALYARAAQLHLAGEPIPWHYMSKGMLAIADPGMMAGGGEHALRVVPFFLGILFVLAAALFARRLAGDAVAAWLVPVIAASLSIAKRSAELLSDMPSAACLLAGIAVLFPELARDDGPRWRVLLVAPLFAAAVYLRYGSVLPIAITGVVALGFYGRAVLRRPARIVALAALFLALLVPHALDARATTGSPLGFLLAGNEALHVEYRGEGIVGFVVNNPFTFYGVVTAPLLVVGLLSIVRPRDRRAVALWLIAVVTIIALGLTTVAESRYVFLSQTLLLVLGIDVVLRWLAARPPRPRKILGYVAVAAVAASWLGVLIPSSRIAARRRHQWDGMLAAAAEVHRDAAGAHCQVVCRHTHQVEWYSGCEALLEVPAPGKEPLYVVRDDFGDFQPPVTGLPGHPRAIFERGEVLVLRVDP